MRGVYLGRCLIVGFAGLVGLAGCSGPAILIGSHVDCAIERIDYTKPTIRRGEFSYELIYKENGFEKIISDTLVCEYEGLSCSPAGLNVEWNRSFLSGEDSIVIRDLGGGKRIISGPPSCRYQMGTTEKYVRYVPDNKNMTLEVISSTEKWWTGIPADELLGEYGLEVVLERTAPPVVQSTN